MEKKGIEKNAINSAKDWKTWAECVPCAVGIYNLYYDDRVELEYLNDSFYSLLDSTRDERKDYTGFDTFNSVFPIDRVELIKKMCLADSGGTTESVDVRCKIKDEQYRWFNVRMKRVEHVANADKSVMCLLISAVDDLHEANESARNSNEMLQIVSGNSDTYQQILNETNTMITIIDAETYEVVYANKKAIESSSLGEEYIGCTCYKGIQHKDTPCEDCLLLKSEDVPEEVKQVSYADHTYRMLKKRMLWNNRRVLLEYSEDITDEVRASQIKDELNRERQKLIDQVPTGIGIYEVKGNSISQIYMNNAFYSMINSTREERSQYFSTSALKSIYPEDAEKIKSVAKELMDGRNSAKGYYRLKNDNEDWIWIHAVASVVERSENYIKLYCAFFECTESKQQELRLLQNQRAVTLAEQQGKISIWTYNIDKGIIIQQIMADAKGHMGYQDKIVNVPDCFIEMDDIHPEDKETVKDAYKRLANGEVTQDSIYRLKNQYTGKYDWVHVYYKRMENNDVGDRMAVGFSLLENEQQKAIEQYHTEKKLREQMYAGATFYLEYNLTKRQYEGNNNIESRYPSEQWESKTKEEYRKKLSTIVDERYLNEVVDKTYVNNLLESYKKGESKITCEYRSKERPERESTWYKIAYMMVKRPDTGDIMAFVSVEDIEKEKERLIAIENSMSDGIEIISVIQIEDGKAMIVRSNYVLAPGGLREYFTYDEEFVRRSHEATVSEDKDFSYNAALLSTVQKELETKEIYQYSISTKIGNGPRKRQLFRFRYLDDRKKQVILSVSDITSVYMETVDKEKKMEEALFEAQKASHAKADFYSRMSHDMRTPMNGVLGMAALSEDETDITKLKGNMVKIKESGEYLLSLINDTLDLQRIESGKMTLEPTIVSTMDVVSNIIDMVSVTAKAKGVQLKYSKGNTDLNWYIRVDALRLKQIFINLLSNAIKFTPAGGVVELEFKLLERENLVSHDVVFVRDTGIGMSKEFMENGMFKPFSQESNAVSANYAGSGLGLSIAKSLVEMMGGRIEVESEQEVGTTFAVYLDFERVPEDEAKVFLQREKLHSDNASTQLKGKSVLLVEDHLLNAEIAEKLLQKVGCEVTWVKNGQEAVKIFDEEPNNTFEVVLMDIRMPIMDGLEATRRIRALDKKDATTVPIIAMTANAYEEDMKASLKAGMNAHLDKPINPDNLFKTISKYIK